MRGFVMKQLEFKFVQTGMYRVVYELCKEWIDGTLSFHTESFRCRIKRIIRKYYIVTKSQEEALITISKSIMNRLMSSKDFVTNNIRKVTSVTVETIELFVTFQKTGTTNEIKNKY